MTTGSVAWRDAHPEDETFARTVTLLAYEDVVRRQFGDWDVADQQQHFGKKWASEKFEIIERGGIPVGLFRVVERPDHLFLNEVIVHPDHQGRGVGTLVMREVLERAARHGLPLRLRVLRMNRARALYERLGLAVTEETEDHLYMQGCAPEEAGGD